MFKNEVHHVVIYQLALKLESVHVNFSRKFHEKPAIRIQISILALQAVMMFSGTVPLDSKMQRIIKTLQFQALQNHC